MSVGRFGDEDAPDERDASFDDLLESDEEVYLSWDATAVHWANEWRNVPDATTFAATDRRVLFETTEQVVSIGYNHVRAVMTDPAEGGFDASTVFVASGGLCLAVGLLVATVDLTNGVGLVALSVMLLVAGGSVGGSADRANVTIVIDNERQRLSFAADEEVGKQLSRLSAEPRSARTRSESDAADELPTPKT